MWHDQKSSYRVAQKSRLPFLLCTLRHIEYIQKQNYPLPTWFLRHIHYVCEPLYSSIVLASRRLLNANLEIEYTMLTLYMNSQHLIKFLSTFCTFASGAKRIGWYCEVPLLRKDQRHDSKVQHLFGVPKILFSLQWA